MSPFLSRKITDIGTEDTLKGIVLVLGFVVLGVGKGRNPPLPENTGTKCGLGGEMRKRNGVAE